MVEFELDLRANKPTKRGPRLRNRLKEMGYIMGDDYVYSIHGNTARITARPGREEVEMLAQLMWDSI